MFIKRYNFFKYYSSENELLTDNNNYPFNIRNHAMISGSTNSEDNGKIYVYLGNAYGTTGSSSQWSYVTDVGVEPIPGPQGIQGHTGAPSTVQGPTGLQGIQGPIGLQGVQGPTGLQGVQGPTGLQGIQGPTGLQGIQGPTGLQGVDGVDGPRGHTGEQGIQGPTGFVDTNSDVDFNGNFTINNKKLFMNNSNIGINVINSIKMP